MKKRTLTKGMLMAALICGCVQWGGTAVHAEELQEFTLDPMIVTAQRMEMRDLDTPATVDVITSEMVERNGGASAYEVLRQSLGLTVTSQGPNGVSYGSMTSEVTIRGVERGTLVLLDGVPLNQDGKYNLEDIPSDIIERVEIVRSGGSVLYGSDASGGVVNIITKKGAANKVKVVVGDMGREQYSVLVGSDNFTANAYYENRGKIDKTSTVATYTSSNKDYTKYYQYNDGERKGIRWNADLNDNFTFYHQYSENENSVSQRCLNQGFNGNLYQTNDYKDIDNNFTLNFDDKEGFKAIISYGTQEKEYYKTSHNKDGSPKTPALSSWRKGHNTNIDLNKTFDIGDNKFLIGASYKKEDMDIFASGRGTNYSGWATYDRDIYSVYASYDWSMSDSDNLIFNARQTFARNCGADYKDNTSRTDAKQKDVNEFTPEVQYIKKLNENSSVYAKMGKSFRLPDLTRIYGSGVISPTYDLYPEEGKHYEIGYKLNEGNKAWRLALFNYKIKNSIESLGSIVGDDLRYVNADTKNTGVELTCDIEHDNNWSSSWGLAYSNPKKKGDYNEDWVKYQDGFQFTASVDYHKDKFTGTVLANYLANRYDNDSEKHPEYKVKPALYTDLHLSYAPEKNQKVFLHLNNLLDREDITTNCAPLDDRWAYISVGFNFMLGYEYSF